MREPGLSRGWCNCALGGPRGLKQVRVLFLLVAVGSPATRRQPAGRTDGGGSLVLPICLQEPETCRKAHRLPLMIPESRSQEASAGSAHLIDRTSQMQSACDVPNAPASLRLDRPWTWHPYLFLVVTRHISAYAVFSSSVSPSLLAACVAWWPGTVLRVPRCSR